MKFRFSGYFKNIKYLFLISSLFFLSLIILFILVTFEKKESIIPINQNNESDFSEKLNEDSNDEYLIKWIKIEDLNRLFLYPNVKEKLPSIELKKINNCEYLVNGGFYTKDQKLIGYFKNQNGQINDSINSNLFDGFFYTSGNNAYISKNKPETSDIAIQSGPLLMFNDKILKLNIDNEGYDRRVLVTTTRPKKVIFIIIYKNNPFLGPKLSEIPDIIEKLEKETSIDIVDILNLDGGSHSAFLTNNITVEESSVIGSFFCFKELFKI